MKPISAVIPLVALFSVTSANNFNVRYDGGYDDKAGTPRVVDCLSDRGSPLAGSNDFGDVKSFPYIGASDVVKSDYSGCGSCWEISYSDGENMNTITVTIVDNAPDGFNLARKAMDDLTDGLVTRREWSHHCKCHTSSW